MASTKTNPIEYGTWSRMKRRCFNVNDQAYDDYGGRGITVCDSWRNSFDTFLADMGLRPSGMSIDRINNDGHYEPSNCRWATPSQQAANRRSYRWGFKHKTQKWRRDVRRKIVEFINLNGEPDQAAKKFKVSVKTVYRAMRETK